MDEEQFVRDVVDRSEWWIGLITRQTIIDQLAHIAAIQGCQPERMNDTEWYELAVDAFGIDDARIRRAVIQAVRR